MRASPSPLVARHFQAGLTCRRVGNGGAVTKTYQEVWSTKYEEKEERRWNPIERENKRNREFMMLKPMMKLRWATIKGAGRMVLSAYYTASRPVAEHPLGIRHYLS
jgi:hypothetical protein